MAASSVTSFQLNHHLALLKRGGVDSKVVEEILPAENLCQRAMTDKLETYSVTSLNPRHPVFERIHQIIDRILRLVPDYPSAKKIVEFYHCYIYRVCQTQGDVRLSLLQGKAPLFASDRAFLDKVIEEDLEHACVLLSKNLKSFIPCSSTKEDPIGYYSDLILQVQEKGNVIQEILLLEKLGDSYFQRGSPKGVRTSDFVWAAKYWNGTYALALKEGLHSYYRDRLINKLEIIEEKACLVFCNAKYSKGKIPSIIERRELLDKIRCAVRTSVSSGEPVLKILKNTTKSLRDLLAHMIHKVMEQIGLPQCKWAVMGMGSMARMEMQPYSDLEFAILVQEESQPIIDYFEQLVTFLDIIIINFGETSFPLLKRSSPTCSGFRFDSGGNVPIGSTFKLIGTPKKIASYQSWRYLRESEVSSIALTTTRLITGSMGKETLHEEYELEVDAVLQRPAKKSLFSPFNPVLVRHIRALTLLRGHIKSFQLDLSKERFESRFFEVKTDMYRLFQSILDTLALFFRLTQKETKNRIGEMATRGDLIREQIEPLVKALQIILVLRLKAQLFYRDGDMDKLYHPRIGKPRPAAEVGQFLHVRDEDVALIEDAYSTLYPLYYSSAKFFEENALQEVGDTKEIVSCAMKNPLRQANLKKDITSFAENCYRNLTPALAERVIQQALALNPNNPKNWVLYTDISMSCGMLFEAIKFLKDLAIIRDDSRTQANLHQLLGKCLQGIHAWYDAIEHYQANNRILGSLEAEMEEISLFRVKIFTEMGNCFLVVGDTEEAEKCFKQGMEIITRLREQLGAKTRLDVFYIRILRLLEQGPLSETIQKLTRVQQEEIHTLFKIQDQKIEEFHKVWGELLHKNGLLLKEKQQYDEAVESFNKSRVVLWVASAIAFKRTFMEFELLQVLNIRRAVLEPGQFAIYNGEYLISATQMQAVIKGAQSSLQFLFIEASLSTIELKIGSKLQRERDLAELEACAIMSTATQMSADTRGMMLLVRTAEILEKTSNDKYLKLIGVLEQTLIEAYNNDLYLILRQAVPVFIKKLIREKQLQSARDWVEKVTSKLADIEDQKGEYLYCEVLLDLCLCFLEVDSKTSEEQLKQVNRLLIRYGREHFGRRVCEHYDDFSKQLYQKQK